MAVLTAYAIGITAFHMEQNESMEKLKARLKVEENSSYSWQSRAIRMAMEMDTQRKEFNDEIHRLEKEKKRLLDTNARMMERMKRLVP